MPSKRHPSAQEKDAQESIFQLRQAMVADMRMDWKEVRNLVRLRGAAATSTSATGASESAPSLLYGGAYQCTHTNGEPSASDESDDLAKELQILSREETQWAQLEKKRMLLHAVSEGEDDGGLALLDPNQTTNFAEGASPAVVTVKAWDATGLPKVVETVAPLETAKRSSNNDNSAPAASPQRQGPRSSGSMVPTPPSSLPPPSRKAFAGAGRSTAGSPASFAQRQRKVPEQRESPSKRQPSVEGSSMFRALPSTIAPKSRSSSTNRSPSIPRQQSSKPAAPRSSSEAIHRPSASHAQTTGSKPNSVVITQTIVSNPLIINFCEGCGSPCAMTLEVRAGKGGTVAAGAPPASTFIVGKTDRNATVDPPEEIPESRSSCPASPMWAPLTDKSEMMMLNGDSVPAELCGVCSRCSHVQQLLSPLPPERSDSMRVDEEETSQGTRGRPSEVHRTFVSDADARQAVSDQRTAEEEEHLAFQRAVEMWRQERTQSSKHNEGNPDNEDERNASERKNQVSDAAAYGAGDVSVQVEGSKDMRTTPDSAVAAGREDSAMQRLNAIVARSLDLDPLYFFTLQPCFIDGMLY